MPTEATELTLQNLKVGDPVAVFISSTVTIEDIEHVTKMFITVNKHRYNRRTGRRCGDGWMIGYGCPHLEVVTDLIMARVNREIAIANLCYLHADAFKNVSTQNLTRMVMLLNGRVFHIHDIS